jgi:hypothetical protein
MIIQPPYDFIVGCRDGLYRSRICHDELRRLYHQAYDGTNPGLAVRRVRFDEGPLGQLSELCGMSKLFSRDQLRPNSVVLVMEEWMQRTVEQEIAAHQSSQEDRSRVFCLDVPCVENVRDLRINPQIIRDNMKSLLSFSRAGLLINS